MIYTHTRVYMFTACVRTTTPAQPTDNGRQRYHAKRASEQPSRVIRQTETCGFALREPSGLRTTWRAVERQRHTATIHCASDTYIRYVYWATCDRYVQPTLRQAWPREYPRPQYAFKISMFNVSCNSHYFTQLAALFIDTRAE